MNQLNLEVSTTEIKPLVYTEVFKWQRRHQQRNISLVTELVSDATVVSIDTHRIEQVLSILMDNAIKYSPSGLPIDVGVKHYNIFIMVTVKIQGKAFQPPKLKKYLNVLYVLVNTMKALV